MKPEPYFPPPPPLDDGERTLLRCSAAGGAHPIRPAGQVEWRKARRLAKLGLGEVIDRTFTVTPAGIAAITPRGA